MDAILWHERMNAFAPHKQEGPIKINKTLKIIINKKMSSGS